MARNFALYAAATAPISILALDPVLIKICYSPLQVRDEEATILIAVPIEIGTRPSPPVNPMLLTTSNAVDRETWE